MKNTTIGFLAVVGFLAVPGIAMAGQLAYATHNVNVRAGPGVNYPVVDVARAGEEVYVYGCLRQRSWCDVDFDGLRGWMSSNYLAFEQRGRRYVGPDAMYRMGTPVITFQFGSYWDRHYRGRHFYRDRHRWERPAPRRQLRMGEDIGRPYVEQPEPRGRREDVRPQRRELRMGEDIGRPYPEEAQPRIHREDQRMQRRQLRMGEDIGRPN